MKSRAEIDALFDMYETFSKDYLRSLAKEKGRTLLNRISGRKDKQYAIDFLTVFCGAIAEHHGFGYDEYDLFVKSTGITTVSYDEFVRMTRLNGTATTLYQMKTFGKDFYFDLSFDFDLMILGLCMCAIDGKITFIEREHMINWVPMPSYTDDRRF
jgi:hypothetical protein